MRPSSSRRRARRDGRCLRLANGGRARTRQGASRLACRPARPSGPSERTVTLPLWWSPRRVGASRVVRRRRSPAGMATVCREAVRELPGAQAEGYQASRIRARSGRRDGLPTSRSTSTASPRRTLGLPERSRVRRRTGAASTRSVAIAASSGSMTTAMPVQEGSTRPTRRAPRAAMRAVRPVRAMGCWARFLEQWTRRGRPAGRGRGAPPAVGGQRGAGVWARTAWMTLSAVVPSISASGRSWMRCRRVGRARALTSSGVT